MSGPSINITVKPQEIVVIKDINFTLDPSIVINKTIIKIRNETIPVQSISNITEMKL